MAKGMAGKRVEVVLSDRDRRLLRDVVDAIRSLKPEGDEPEGRTRLVEDWPPPADKDPHAFYNVSRKPKRPDVSAVFKREVEWK